MEKEQELHAAAFNAWMALGVILAKRKAGGMITIKEIEDTYLALQAALKRYDEPVI